MDQISAEPFQLPRKIVALSAGEIAARVLGFAGMVLIARTFDAAVFGVISIGYTLLALSSVIGSFGLDILGVRLLASNPLHARRHVTEILSAKLLLVVPAMLVFFLFIAFYARGGTDGIVVIALFALPLFLNPFSLDYVLTANERNTVVGTRTIIQAITYFIGIVITTRFMPTVVLVPAFLLISILCGLAYVYTVNPVGVRWSFAGGARAAIQTIRSSAFIGGSQIVVAVYLQVSILLLGLLLAFDQVGVYTAAQRIVTAIAFLPSIVLQIFMARISVSESPAARVRVTAEFLLPLSIAGSFLCGNLFLLAPDVIAILYGSSYAGAVQVLRILLVSTLLTYIGMCFANPLPLWKRERSYFTIVAIGAGANIASCILFVHWFGINGAAFSMLLTEFLILAFSLRVFSSITRGAARGALLFGLLPIGLPVAAVLFTMGAVHAGPAAQFLAFNLGIISAAVILYRHRDAAAQHSD